jgi:hypothetical protein
MKDMRKVLTITTFGLMTVLFSYAQQKKEANHETIEGNGKIVTKDIPVLAFDELKANGVYELQLSQGNKESVKIEADENLQELFDVHNEGSKLIIDMKKTEHKNLKIKDKMKVYVTFRKLKNIELGTVGNVSSNEPLTFDDLQINNKSVGHVKLSLTVNQLHMRNTSVGNVDLNGKAQNAVVKNSGVGSIKAGDFIVQTMNIENTGVGSAEVNAEKDLKVKDSFLGKVHNKGAARIRKMNKVVI